MAAETRIDYIAKPVRNLSGELIVPGDKSISHRAIILGSIADGTTRIRGLLDSDDSMATVDVFSNLGVQIENHNGTVEISGSGLHGLHAYNGPLYFGNSGTSVRLITGILAAQDFDSTLTGDKSLSGRPMRRIIDPLLKMGAAIRCSEKGTLPMEIKGGGDLHGIRYELPVASAQLKSCILLAGLYAQGKTCVIENAVTRDHTERMIDQFGGSITRNDNSIEVLPATLHGTEVVVPGDISSAAFFMVAGSICPGSDIILRNVGINPTRSAIIEIMRLMGADIRVSPALDPTAEPVADIRVKHSQLNGIQIPVDLVPVAIDEFPAIMVAAACAEGDTILTGAAELRVKESDRIEAVTDGLTRLGIHVKTSHDGMQVSGGRIHGGEIDSYGDHRIAMAFAIAATVASSEVRIQDCVNVNTSYPGFVESALSIGCDISVQSINA